MRDEDFTRQAVALAATSVAQGGGPFGALVVRDGVVLGRGNNCVTLHNDPTAHAEVQAIRDACQQVGDFSLDGATLYASCEPCPMCLAAIYWARIGRIVYAASREEAAAAGFDDGVIAHELQLPEGERRVVTRHLLLDTSSAPFQRWRESESKVCY